MRQVLRRAKTCVLSTLSPEDGMPYGSLANIATDISGRPIILISRLAWHTQYLEADARASVLVGELPAKGDALVGPRVTVMGRFERIEDNNLRRRYLARHPQSTLYADFPDFSFWRLSPSAIHGVAGFGRIETLTPDEVFPPAEEMTALEMSAIEHMNHDHAEAIHLYATKVLKAQPGHWRILAIDPDGADLGLDEQSLRMEFHTPVFTADALRKKFAQLAYQARTL